MEELTAQEIFETIWDHFMVKLWPRSVVPDGGCRYRSANGTKCAVGVLLSDAECVSSEGNTVENLRDLGLLPPRLLPHLTMLTQLQRIHDRAMNDVDMRIRLRAFAGSNDFNVRAPETL